MASGSLPPTTPVVMLVLPSWLLMMEALASQTQILYLRSICCYSLVTAKGSHERVLKGLQYFPGRTEWYSRKSSTNPNPCIYQPTNSTKNAPKWVHIWNLFTRLHSIRNHVKSHNHKYPHYETCRSKRFLGQTLSISIGVSPWLTVEVSPKLSSLTFRRWLMRPSRARILEPNWELTWDEHHSVKRHPSRTGRRKGNK